MTPSQAEHLRDTIEHIDIRAHDVRPLVQAMGKMAFQARNLHRAATLYDAMLRDERCGIILCLAGSLFSAGLKQVVVELVRNRMVDAIVATGALIVDQDFFEALGFRHYRGRADADDNALRELHIDRIYDTFINEDELRECDATIATLASALEPRPYSSREFIGEMGRYLAQHGKTRDSVVLAAHEAGVPIFVPAFSDCSAGFGLVRHQWERQGQPHLSIDSARDFLELTRCRLAMDTSGLFMVGGGVPKNFAQDVVVAADFVGKPVDMHQYAIQLTVADERDGALSGSTLREASSWGKVSTVHEQMVYGEATVTLPLVAGYAFHQRGWEGRPRRRLVDACR
ncbi:deoxyhypusine synthase [Myxococcaceae bacterium JPH2]|nr:deoxyhypusine synthase [Myxococcaceae bacterium JPH2]